jgi:hypothetical protein
MTEEDDGVAKALDELSEIGQRFQKIIDAMEKEQEEYWASLSSEQQLMAFCAVSRRIYDGEIKQKGTYRYVLYNVFGFGPEAYMPAQCAGYLEIHNAIFDSEHEADLLKAFAKFHGLGEDAVDKFYETGSHRV